MKFPLFVSSFLCFIALCYAEHDFSLSADKIFFHHGKLHLEGNIFFRYKDGTILAQNAYLENTEDKDHWHIHLFDQLTVSLPQNTTIICEEADIVSGNLVLSSPLSHIKIQKDIDTCPISLICDHITTSLLSPVSSLHLQGNILLQYQQKYYIEADEADYLFQDSARPLFCFYPGIENVCRLSSEEGEVFAKKGTLDLIHHEMTLEKPNGHLLLLQKDYATHISSDSMQCNITTSSFSLSGNVTIDHPNSLHISSSSLQYDPKRSHLQFLGTTTLSNQNTTVSCNGIISIDTEKKVAKVYSLQNLVEPAVFIRDPKVFLSAKEGTMIFQLENGQFHPQKILLTEGVSFSSKDNKMQGLAESLTFFPESQRCILAAKDQKKVLFWQQDKEMKLSADEIHIQLDEKGKSEDIQGIGHLRFSFNIEEEEIFHSFFSEYRIKR